VLTAADPNPLAPYLIDWQTFWTTDHTETEWLLEPLFAKGRAHAIYAGAKVGKSFVTLAACAALATGQPFLRKPQTQPQHVLYVDYEMTPQTYTTGSQSSATSPQSSTTSTTHNSQSSHPSTPHKAASHSAKQPTQSAQK
jgi:hypothetical protein